VAQSLYPHSNSKPKTTQTKKATIPKASSVVCNPTPPHPHKEQKLNSWVKELFLYYWEKGIRF
jgi:hypothetical protein